MNERDAENADHQRELDDEQRMIESEMDAVRGDHKYDERKDRMLDERLEIESEQRLKRRKENAQDLNDADAKSGDHHRSPWEYL
jgi:hypothetical protein